MGLFRKKVDPISDRARTLSSEIAALEAQIRKYESSLGRGNASPSTATADPSISTQELNLENIGRRQLAAHAELEHDMVHVNEFGVQKYDLPGLVSRIRSFFRAPTTSNPKLVNYLAAGGIQGLRPLRYEKRVARNRFIVFALILLALLIGLLTVFVPR
jgi:hypothetical protein